MYTGLEVLRVIAIFSLFLGLINVKALPCNDSRCKTGSCNSTGACICNFPDPSTFLDGDRPFLGGKFYDEEMTMCDGTNSFWCEHGGECEEIVQGESYMCKCLPGFTGGHCEHSGAPCGRSFCFNQAQAQCLVEDGICECPPDWKGSTDCSLPTKPQTDSSMNATGIEYPQKEITNRANWMVVGLAFSCSVAAVAGGAIYVKKLCRKKDAAAAKFKQLSQVRIHGMLDDDGSGDEERSYGSGSDSQR